jgi:hypothetical protein
MLNEYEIKDFVVEHSMLTLIYNQINLFDI